MYNIALFLTDHNYGRDLYSVLDLYGCRIEKLGVHTRVGKLKTMGALLCLAGALTVSLYKGPAVIKHQNVHQLLDKKDDEHNYLRGTMCLVGSVLSYGLWFIFQVSMPNTHYVSAE